MLRLSLAQASALLLALAPLGRAQGAREHVEPELGYRIQAPPVPWALGRIENPPGVSHTLKISRADEHGEASLTVYVLDQNPGADAVAAATLAERRYASDRGCTKVARLGNRVRFDYGPETGRYSVSQRYHAHHGHLYVVQCAAPAARFDAELIELAAIEATFAFVDIADPAAAERAALHRRLAARCGSEVAWAADWPAAARRAAAEGRLVIVLVERYRGVPVGQTVARSTAFVDPEVVELVRERFVAYEWRDPSGAPFEDPAVYGLGGSTFGHGVLFVRPNGTVAGECVSFVPGAVYHRALEVLAAESAGASTGSLDAATCLRRGELARCDELLRAPATPAEWRLKGALLARQRRGEEALAAYARADGDTAVESAAILSRLGRYYDAEERIRATATSPDAPPAARFVFAIARAMRLGLEPIQPELAALCKDHPDSPWAWRAAAMLVGTGILSGLDPIAWLDPAVLAAGTPSAPEPLATADVARAEREAISFLLATQAPRGTWPLPMVSLVTADGPAAVAAAAIGATALLPHRARPEVRAAIDRALAYVLTVVLGPPATPSAHLFDYAVWAEIFGLRFLARCHREGVGDRPRLEAAMALLVGRLRVGRQAGGGWSYVRYPGVTDNSIGFVTAAAMRALEEAKAAGAVVEEDLLSRAAGVLVRLRRASGAFGYMALTGPGSDDAQAEAALRSPLYAHALQDAGAGDVDGIRRALDVYLAHRLHVRRERGKGLCHTGPEGHASYYLLYGYAFAAEAVRALPVAERARYCAALTEDVLYLRCADGGFCDNAAMGRSYGAAQALIAFSELAAAGR